MVDAVPLALVAVGAQGAPCCPPGRCADVDQPAVSELLQRMAVGIVVEVARHDDISLHQRCCGLQQRFGHALSVRACGQLAAIAAGSMYYEHMQRVAADGLALYIEYVARRAHVGQGLNGNDVVAQRAEARGMVEQCHVDAAHVGRAGHQVVVSGGAQQRAARQVAHGRVVLYFHQSHQVRQVGAAREQLLPDGVHLAPVAGACPAASAVGQELLVLLVLVMAGVEEVLAVQLYEGEPLGGDGGNEEWRNGEKEKWRKGEITKWRK